MKPARARNLRLGGCVLAIALLFACDRASRGYLPFQEGHWWFYETVSNVRGELTHERTYVTNERLEGGVLRQRHQAEHVQRLRETAAGIVRLDDQRAPPHQGLADQDLPAQILIVPRDPEPGFVWKIDSELRLIESRTFAVEDRLLGRRLPLELTAQVIAVDEMVTVPAGHFPACLHLMFTGNRMARADRGSLQVEVSVAHHAWYAPGVGLVKATREETSHSTFLRDGTYTQSLLAFGR